MLTYISVRCSFVVVRSLYYAMLLPKFWVVLLHVEDNVYIVEAEVFDVFVQLSMVGFFMMAGCRTDLS